MENNELDVISNEIKRAKQEWVNRLSVRYSMLWLRIWKIYTPMYPSPTSHRKKYNAEVEEHAKLMRRLSKVNEYLKARRKREIEWIYNA